jgi:hypothetical protein
MQKSFAFLLKYSRMAGSLCGTFLYYFPSFSMILPERVRGMQDIFGEYQRYFTFIKKVARHEFRKNGFTRISTPIIERLELVARGV